MDSATVNDTTINITSEDFEYIRKMLREHSAIVLDDGKEYLAEARLGPLVRQEGVSTVSELVIRLQKTPFGRLHSQVVEALATNETSFFRDSTPYESLKTEVIPQLIKLRENERQINIWCAASSSGQEPYSVAMLLKEHFLVLKSWNVHIFATDLSREMVERTAEGRYSQLEINRGLPAPLLVKYFQKDGTGWRIKDEIRSMVDPQELNLVNSWGSLPRMDIVLLRNVLIYFDIETRLMIFNKLRSVLKPDGFLLLGGGETTMNLDDGFQRVHFGKCDFYQFV